MLRSFWQDRRGNAAMMVGLAMMPLTLLLGTAVDYTRAVAFRDFARGVGDAAALAIAGADVPDAGGSELEAARKRIVEVYGTRVENLLVTGSWADLGTYRIRLEGALKAYVLPAVPGLSRQSLPVVVDVRVVRVPAKYETQPPTMSMLSPEAADYNRVYMYCYDETRKSAADKGRRGMTAIADNGDPGLDYSKNVPPSCGEGELVAYKLRNVRNARANRGAWEGRGQEVYEYYTDTTMDRGTRVVKINLTGGRVDASGEVTLTVDVKRYPLLETILCDTKEKCRSRDQGGILPNNHETGRTPATATAACSEGKYMYYGYEDRPGGDQDYDDIRLVISCPKEIKIRDKQVHLSE